MIMKSTGFLQRTWRAEQQAVLGRDAGGNGLRPDAIVLLLQMNGAHDVDAERTVYPAGKLGGVSDREIVATRQDGDARAGGRRAIEHQIRQVAASMARDDNVGRTNRRVVERAGDKRNAAGESRPCVDERVVQPGARGRQNLVDCKCGG